MIAKVEPLTTARALRGPFDYRLGESMAGVGVGSMLVVPFARRRILGVVVDVAEHSDVPPDKLAEPLSALEADVPAELVNLGLWVAHEYVSTPARGLALVLPPGTGTGSGRRIGPRKSLRASITAAGRQALEGDERLGTRQRAGARGPGRRPRPGERPGLGNRLRPRRRPPAGGARPGRAGAGRQGTRPAPHVDGGCPARRARTDRRAGGGAGPGSSRRWTRRPARTAGCCCTA